MADKNELTRTDCCGGSCDTVDLATVRPKVDVLERDDAWLLVVDLPGVSPDDIELNFNRSELTLAASVSRPASTDEYLLNELQPVRFERSFRVGDGIDRSKIRGDVVDGVLTVTLPKAEELQPRKINVSGAGSASG